MSVTVDAHHQDAGRIPEELQACIAAGAEALAQVFDLVSGLVFNIAEAERAGIEAVLSGAAVEPITAPLSWVCSPVVISKPPLPAKMPVCSWTGS